jgi:hypothetical protein
MARGRQAAWAGERKIGFNTENAEEEHRGHREEDGKKAA